MINPPKLQQQLDTLLPTIQGKTVLLHSCCGPCSSYVMEYLALYVNLIVFFYNPNIAPAEEYEHRKQEQIKLIKQMKFPYSVTFLESEYNPAYFFSSVKGLEQEPEGGKRCDVCFRIRLEETAKMAIQQNADFFATTLSVSPHKNSLLLEEISQKITQTYQIPHLPADFKKKGGYQRSLQLSKEYDLYRQNYCGCPFSMQQNTKKE